MSGEMDLGRMIRTLEPALDPRQFSFSTDPTMTLAEAVALSPLGIFTEAEGLTLIREGGEGPFFSMISLSVHSSLEAVGLTAAISTALSDAGISANVVAAFYHDHVFVAEADAVAAVAVLRKLANGDDTASGTV